MTVTIMGHEYEIIMRKELSAFGKASLGDGIIYIDTECTIGQRTSTLLHEAIEMIRGQLELNMNHPAVCGVETGLYQFLTENGVDLSPLEELVK